MVKFEDYKNAVVNTVDIILNEATKAGLDIALMKELVQEPIPSL